MNSVPTLHPAAVTAAAWRGWWAALRPAPLAIDARERWRIVCGVGLGLLLTGLLSRLAATGLPSQFMAGSGGAAWLVAPLGASAVLVFGVPASPLAQPWSVVGGNTVSALVGIAFVNAMPLLAAPVPVVVAIACAVAVGLMIALRCLHPPGGAAALLTVLGGVADWRFALFPVLLNSLLLVAAGMAYNPATGRRYPHRPAPPMPSAEPQRFTDADLDDVIARYNQVLEVPRDDLRRLLEGAELASHRRRLGATLCSDIMSGEVASVEFGTPLQDAWTLMRERRVKALPVVDRARRVTGIVTRSDFLQHAEPDLHVGLQDKLRRLILATPGVHSDKPEVVGQIMAGPVHVAAFDRPLAEVLPLFIATGHHHLPIVDADGRLVGMVTQSDVVKSLAGATAG